MFNSKFARPFALGTLAVALLIASLHLGPLQTVLAIPPLCSSHNIVGTDVPEHITQGATSFS